MLQPFVKQLEGEGFGADQMLDNGEKFKIDKVRFPCFCSVWI